jgi:hypothetical protein
MTALARARVTRTVAAAAVLLLLALPARTATVVVCAPGYPGSTKEAQPTMDAFAAAAGDATGWPRGDLAAVYHETEAGGLARLAQPDAAFALVPLPFWLEHRDELRLTPRLQAVQQDGLPSESWTLVAGRGKVGKPADLGGFTMLSLAGYVPRFVRGPALASWGELPPSVTIRFSGALLSGLRKAAAGENVVLLLDRAQAAALPTLPFASELEVVATSPPLPVSVLCTVGTRIPVPRADSLVRALASLGASPAGQSALAGMRLSRFVPADEPALARARSAFDRVPR